MEIQKTLVYLQKEINKRLEDFFKNKIKEAKNFSLPVRKMLEVIQDFVLAEGKRIRPILVYYGYLAGGGKNKEAILDATIFMELIHDFLLIHDDIIDQDEFRRGGLTLHQRYHFAYQKIGEKRATHLGICAGILAGDLLVSFGYEILASARFPERLKNKALDRLSRMLNDVIFGQTLDVFLGVDHQVWKKDIFKILEYKTARYTVEGPLQIGAILAGDNDETLKTLSRYAIPLGIAFQLQDDILGMFGDEYQTGKPVGSDLKEGKQTFLIWEARRKASPEQRKIINQALGDTQLTSRRLERIREIIIETEALKYSQELAEKLVNQAKAMIEKAKFPDEVKQFLSGIADYIIRREK